MIHKSFVRSFTAVFIAAIMFGLADVQAAPTSLSYQGRIMTTNNVPLEYQSVSFEFSITSPDGSCIIYREQKNGVDMRNSKGVFDTPIGAAGASKLFPSTPSFTLTDAFKNSGTLNCEGGSTYGPSIDDTRKLRVQFYDGTSWNLISPDTLIRSVPYALQADSAINATVAQKLGNYSATDFLRLATIPVCGAGYVLTSSTLGVLSCQDLSTTSVRPSGSAGGDLTGSYPNPTIAGNAVTTSKIADGAVTGNKLETLSVTAGAYGSSTQIPTVTVDSKGRVTAISTSSISAMPSAGGGASGKFLKSDGTSWSAENVLVTDVKNASGTAVFTLSACASNKALTWSAGTNTFVCQDIDGLAWSAITSGKPTTVSGYGITDAVKNAGSTVSIQSGADTSKGAPGTDGRVYIATDTQKIYRDDGSAWVQIASNAGTGGTVSSVTAGTGLATAPGAGITTTGSIGIAVGGVTATELASNAVTTVKIANGNVTGAKLEDITTAGSYGSGTSVPAISVDAKGRVTSVTATAITGLLPDASVSSGKYLKSDGSNWSGQDIRFSDIKNSMGGSAFAAGISGCGDNQTVKWNVLTDTFNCQNIGSLDADKITTGVIDPARLGTGTASSSTFLRGDGTWDTPTLTESDPKVGASSTNYLSKWDGTKLVDSSVYENGGNVGLGTASPSYKLDSSTGSSAAAARFSISNSATTQSANIVLSNENNTVNNRSGISAYNSGGGMSSAIQFINNDHLGLSSSSGSLSLVVVDAGAVKEALRVSSSGNIGIGTLTPGSALDVSGTIRTDTICDRSGTNCKTVSGGWGGGGSVTSVTAGSGLVTTPGAGITTSGSIGLDVELAAINALSTTGFVKRTGTGAYSTSSSLNLTTDVTGVLPIANGGTNSNTALTNNQLMFSNSGAIKELGTMSNGQIVVGKTSSAPQIVTLSGDATISDTGVLTLGTGAVTSAKILDGTVTGSDLNFGGVNSATTSFVMKDSTGAFYDFACSTDGHVPTWTASGFACQAPSITETDPKVGANTTNYLSKWDGSKLVASTVIENSGKVGIGLSNPAVSLQVVDGSNTQISIGPSTAASANAQLSLYGKNSGVANETMIIASWLGDLRFKPKAGQDITLEDGNGADILVTKGGNKRVGISTGSPGSELDVNGTIRATAICDRSGTNCKTISGGWGGSGTVTSVTATAPLAVTDTTTTPNITIPAATASVDGYLKSSDFTTFNSKLSAVTNTASLANAKIWVGDSGGKAQEQTPGGDVTMNASGSFSVTKLQNRTIASTAPTSGTMLKWNSSLTQWEPWAFATCSGVSQVLHYASATDTWTCDTLSVTSATGTLPIANGGTGATTAANAINALLPTQTGNSGKFLTTNGSAASWGSLTAAPAGANTQVQFNNSGALGASASLAWDNTNSRLDIGSGTVQNSVAGLNIVKSQNAETSIDLANATNGTASLTAISLYNNNGYQGSISTGSSTYATPGYKDRFVVESSSNAGGLTLRAGSATVGDIRFITGSWNERMRLDKDGKLGIGTTSPNFLVDVRQSDAEPVLSVQNSNSTAAYFPGFRAMNYMGSVGSGYAQFTVINGRGSDASPSSVQSGDTLGSFNFHGAKNTAWGIGLGASINAVATETYSNTANGAYLAFATTNTGTATNAERMRIGANGNVSIGNTSLGARLDVSSAGTAANETGFILRNPSTAAYSTVNYDFYTAGGYKGSFWTMRDNTGSGGIFGISTANTSGVGAERMRIDQNGNMGLGMSPAGSARLAIGGSGTPLWIDSTNSTETKITFADNGTQRGYIGASATKAFYVGGAGGAWMVLDTSGNLSISGTTYTPSDRRYKEKITTVEESLNKILTLHGVTYNWKPSTGKSADRQMGVIAQEVEKVFPEAVRTEDSGYKTVNYVALFAPVIESIKELYAKVVGHDQQLRQLASEKADRAEIEALKKENEKLKQKNAEFEERLKRLEQSR